MSFGRSQRAQRASVMGPAAAMPSRVNDDIYKESEVPPRRAGKEWLPYRGEPGLIIAIDLGTTYSGASYCILTPGKKPNICDVKSFPGQTTSGSKVPSVVLYNADGQPALYGAEAVDGAAAQKILVEGGASARWWKLYLKPANLELIIDPDAPAPDLDPLPFGVTAETIAAQFLAYMVSCVGKYIVTRHSNGSEILASLAESIRYVITVPNGWEVAQQQVLRNACIQAGLVAPERADTVSFVTEAEASINYCAQSPAAHEWLCRDGQQLIVCDAGGGTIDISTYQVTSMTPNLVISETSASDCLLAGSTTVDRRARDLISERLRNTEWNNEADLDDFQQRFCASIKEAFSDKTQEQYLAITSSSVTRQELGIQSGKLVFTGEEIAQLFEPSIRAMEQSIVARVQGRGQQTVPVAMVGGFSESAFLRKEVQARLGSRVRLCKPDEATAKAVANGGVAWLIDGVVNTRVARQTYGIRCSTFYREGDPVHEARKSMLITGNDGKLRLPSSFGAVIKKDQSGSEQEEHLEKFTFSWHANMPLHKDISLYVYRGVEEAEPEFIDLGEFEELCKFRVDMEPFRSLLVLHSSPAGQPYYRVPVHLAMKLHGTELAAHVLFEHEGMTYRGPTSVFTAADAE